MKRLVLNVFLLCLLGTVYGTAAEYRISGVVVEVGDSPLPSASVILRKSIDPDFKKGGITNIDGEFQFDELAEGKYILEISYVGFKTKIINIELTPQAPIKRYKKIILQEDAALISVVEVSAKRASLQVDIDKKTFLVNESAVSEGMSASEVLREIPSVDVDVEGNISMRSNENVEIYINGRPSGLSDDNRGDILEQLPAGSIDRIEIISNPSSKFSAEGSAGIINIVMKSTSATTDKSTYYGSVTAGLSYPWGWKPGGNLGASINYTKNKWSTSASVGYTNKKSFGKSKTERETYKGDTILLYQNGETKFNMNTVFARIASSYDIDSTNKIGFSGMISTGGRERDQFLCYDKGRKTTEANEYSFFQDRNSFTESNRTMGNATIDYLHLFAPGHSLTTAFNFSANNGKNDRDYEQYEYAAPSRNKDNRDFDYLQYQHTHNHNRNFEGQIDYVNPLTATSKLESGLKATFSSQFNKVNSSIQRNANDGFLSQPELDNDFELHQNIYAAYASYGKIIRTIANESQRSFSMQVGLRGEVTQQDWALNTTGESNTRKPYFDLFPTAFLSYKINTDNELQLSYTRRISRPRRPWVNPYINVSDSTNISFGNPDLNPEYTNAFELNYIKIFDNHTFTSTLYYQLMQDVIQRYSWMNGDAMVSTRANMTNSHSTGLELILKDSWKVVSLTNNVNLYYYKLSGGDFKLTTVYDGKAENVSVTIKDRESFSWSAKTSADFALPKSFSLQVTGDYLSPKATAQGKTLSTYFFNAGIKRAFLQKKLVATLTMRDITDSRKRRSETWNDTFYQLSENRWSGRTLNLNVTYNFGSNYKKNDKKERGKSDSSFDEDVFEEF